MMGATTAELTIRMLVSLVLVSGMLWMVTQFARKRLRAGSAAAALDVCNRHQLTKSSAVAVVRAGHRHFLVGVNDHAITLLAEGDDLILATDDGDGSGDQGDAEAGPVVPRPASTAPEVAASKPKRSRAIVDVRRSGARKRRGGAASASSGIGVIEALRERSVRR
jgi:flagellar biogenesis protein FliO